MTIDLFGRKARADLARLQKKHSEATHRIQHLEGCKATLTEINGKHVESLNRAHVHMARTGAVHAAVRRTLVDECATGIVDGLAGGWALKVADALAEHAGVDLRPEIQQRINEMSGTHEMPRPHLVDGEDARQHPAEDTAEPAQPAETGEDGEPEAVAETDQDTAEIEQVST